MVGCLYFARNPCWISHINDVNDFYAFWSLELWVVDKFQLNWCSLLKLCLANPFFHSAHSSLAQLSFFLCDYFFVEDFVSFVEVCDAGVISLGKIAGMSPGFPFYWWNYVTCYFFKRRVVTSLLYKVVYLNSVRLTFFAEAKASIYPSKSK